MCWTRSFRCPSGQERTAKSARPRRLSTSSLPAGRPAPVGDVRSLAAAAGHAWPHQSSRPADKYIANENALLQMSPSDRSTSIARLHARGNHPSRFDLVKAQAAGSHEHARTARTPLYAADCKAVCVLCFGVWNNGAKGVATSTRKHASCMAMAAWPRRASFCRPANLHAWIRRPYTRARGREGSPLTHGRFRGRGRHGQHRRDGPRVTYSTFLLLQNIFPW